MRNIRRFLLTAAATLGVALAGAAGTAGSAAAEPSSGSASAVSAATTAATPAAVPAQGWLWVGRWQPVFSAYGGPSTIGTTADEMIYAYCQHNGLWGWQTYAWVPSLNSYGWLRNGDITGYTDPILGLDVC
jgi:hypothetical protein